MSDRALIDTWAQAYADLSGPTRRMTALLTRVLVTRHLVEKGVSLMSMNPVMMERVAQARMAEMRRVVAPRSDRSRRTAMDGALGPGPGGRRPGQGVRLRPGERSVGS